MDISEAERFCAREAARPAPCQVLDHAGGYFLAAGIVATSYMHATKGGFEKFDVSLAVVIKLPRSLGQF